MKKVKIAIASLAMVMGVAGAFTSSANNAPTVTTNYASPNCTGTVISQPSGCTATSGTFCYSRKVDNNPCQNFYFN